MGRRAALRAAGGGAAALAGVALAGGGATGTRPARAQPAEPPDPVAVIDAYTAAINAWNVEAALAFVADDAVYLRPGGRFVGRDEVGGFIEGLVRQQAEIELLGEREAFGTYVRWRSRVTLHDPERPDAPPTLVQNQSESIVAEGRILFHHAVRAP